MNTNILVLVQLYVEELKRIKDNEFYKVESEMRKVEIHIEILRSLKDKAKQLVQKPGESISDQDECVIKELGKVPGELIGKMRSDIEFEKEKLKNISGFVEKKSKYKRIVFCLDEIEKRLEEQGIIPIITESNKVAFVQNGNILTKIAF